MKLIIVEKPSVGQSVAKVIGATTRKDGYIEGNGYIVSWCIGHLVGLANAEDYDEKYKTWSIETLPIIPTEFKYKVADGKKKQLDLLCNLLNRNDIEYVINGCDAGREGELIFRLVYNYSKSTKPIKRLWISSMEDVAIKVGLENLRDGSEFERLYESALCRLQADWIVGINATRLFSSLYQQTLNVGRVMSPTLTMIVQRNFDIQRFKPKPFYNIIAENDDFSFTSERFEEKEEVENILENINDNQLVIENVESKEKSEKPPKLYDLTTLQRESNRKLGYTANETLNIVQSLYEKKLTTYPRTDSNYLTEDMEGILHDISINIFDFLDIDINIYEIPENTEQVINNKKVTDHHAIIPTQTLRYCDREKLSKEENEILNLISIRYISALAENHIYNETVVTAKCGDLQLKTKGKVVVYNGFKMFEKLLKLEEITEKRTNIPTVKTGDIIDISPKIKEGKTSSPKNFTEDTLLSAMEKAGMSDEELEVEKEFCGLGTPATRSGIIEKLVSTQFLERQGSKKTKTLAPSRKGVALISILPQIIQSPVTTAEWEKQLKQVENGELSADEFMADIEKMIRSLVDKYEVVKDADELFPSRFKTVGTCPRCSKNVVDSGKAYNCSDRECGFSIWKDNKFFTVKKKKLTEKIVVELLEKGQTRLNACYSEKTGKTYNATILLDDTGGKFVNFKMEFDKK